MSRKILEVSVAAMTETPQENAGWCEGCNPDNCQGCSGRIPVKEDDEDEDASFGF